MIIKLGAVAEWALIIVWTSHRLREKLQKGKRWILKLKIISNTVLRLPFVSTIWLIVVFHPDRADHTKSALGFVSYFPSSSRTAPCTSGPYFR